MNKCIKCGNKENYNFQLDIGLCNQCISAKLERMEDALRQIKNWSQAYPLKIFPKPNLRKAAKVLKDNGMTLDSISADNMRHVFEGINDIVGEAFRDDEKLQAQIDGLCPICLQQEKEKLKKFARKVIASECWELCGGMDGLEIQDFAEELGLVAPFILTEADIKTGEYPDYEAGDIYYKFTEILD